MVQRNPSCGMGGGAQIVQFVITSVDCEEAAAIAEVTDVICSGAEAVIGDIIDLMDPLGFLIGNPQIVEGVSGMAVKMSEEGPYGDCVYKILSTGDLGYNC